MIGERDVLEGLAMRSSGVATGTRTATPACSISTTTGPTTTTTTSACADPRKQHPGAGQAGEGTLLGRTSRGEPSPKARHHAHPGTAAGAPVAAAEHGSDFYRLTGIGNLFGCWRKSKRQKGRCARVQRFAADPLHYISLIQERLRNRTYTFGPYRSFTVREKKFRLVVDAPMKDRIVHWMLYDHLLPTWLPRFIHDTYGNLPGRGTHAAVQRLADFTRRPANTWVLQLDISKYFHAVPFDRLKKRVLRYQGDEDIRRLIVSLIESYRTGDTFDHLFPPESAYRRTAGKGMPIGNLPSQLFANIYLCGFDHWAKDELGLRYFIRYVDDIVVLGSSREKLIDIAEKLIDHLEADGLTVHPRKVRLAPVAAGIPFLGYVVHPNHISAGQRLRKRYHYRLREHERDGRDRSEAIRSYLAALSHTGSTRYRRQTA